MKIRKIIAMLLVLSAISSIGISTAFAEENDADKTLKVKKTLTWDPSTDVNHAQVTISSNVPDISETKVLFIGTLCQYHKMDANTVKESLNAIAVNAEVDYYLFNKDSGGAAAEYDHGHIKKGGTFTGSVTLPESANHAALIGFASTIISEISDMDSYDYIVLEFDGSRIGNEDLSDTTATDTLTACANKLKPYYAANKVIWITDGAGNTSSREYGKHAYVPSNIYYYGSKDNEKKVLSATNFRNLCALVAPEYYLAHTTANTEYYGDGKTEKTLSAYSLTPGEKVKDNVTGALYPDYADLVGTDYYIYKDDSRQMYYNNADDLAKFLFMAIKGATLSFTDKIKASNSDSLLVTDVNLYVSSSSAASIDDVGSGDWKLFDSFTDVEQAEPVKTDSGNISYVENTSKEITVTVKNTNSQNNNLVTVNATDLKSSIKWAKLVINLEDENGFRCCMSPKLDGNGQQEYNEKGYPMYEMNPNDGPATVNSFSGGSKAEGSADFKHEWGDGTATGIAVLPHKVSSSVTNGQNSYSDTVQSVPETKSAIEKVTFEGDKVVLTYMPASGAVLKTLKIDGSLVSLTDGSYSSDTPGYEVSVETAGSGQITITIPELAQDRSIDVEFKAKPMVSISKAVVSPASGTIKGGEDIEYSIAVRNDGAEAVSAIAVSDVLATSYVTYKSGTVPEGVTASYDSATGKVTWTIAELQPGEAVTIPLVVTVKPDLIVGESGKELISNVAAVTEISGDSVTGTSSIPAVVVAVPRDLTVKYVFTGTYKDITAPPTDSTVLYGDKLTPKTAAQVPGYTFTGWFTDEACTAEFDSSTSFVNGNLGITDEVSSVNLYGKWEYCVGLDKEITTAHSADAPLRGGDEVEYKITVTNTSGTDITVTGTDAGITVSDKLCSLLTYVDGSASDCGVYDSATATITWTGIEVNANSTKSLTFKAKISGTITAGTEIPNRARGEHGSEKFESAANENNSFEAQPKLLTVTYQYVGDAPSGAASTSAMTDSSVEYGSSYDAAEDPTLDGYVFHGWYTDEGCTTAYTDGTVLTAGRTLYGKWTSVKDFDISKSVTYNSLPITDTVAPGSTVTYSITVTNRNAIASISDVVITDTLPAGLTGPVADNGGSISGNTVTWKIDIAKGSSKTLTVNATVPGDLKVSKTFDNIAAIVSAEGEPVNKNSNTVSFTEKPENITVAVTKSWSDTWDNHSSEEVKVRMFANGAPTGDLITLSKDNPSWSGIVTPYDASGSAIAYTFREVTLADVETTFDAGEMNGRYKVSYGSTPTGGVLIENNYVIDASDLAFNKTADGTAAPGGSFKYILTVKNNRTFEKATGIVVTDTLPQGLTLAENGLAPAGSDTASAKGSTITWTIPELAGGATAKLEITVNVPADVTAAEYENVASITKVGQTEYGEKEVPSEKALTEVRTFKVTKSWSDTNESHSDVTVKLLRNGDEYDITTLDDYNDWTCTWTNLPLYDGLRAKYVYTVSEISVEGYTGVVNYSGSDDGNTSAVVTNTLKTYGISYVAKGSDQPSGVAMPSDVTVEYGSAYTAEALPSAEYYEFSGWFTDEDCTTPYTDGTAINDTTAPGGSLTLFGKWERKTAEITFECGPVGPAPADVAYPETETINQGETPDAPPAPEYSGDDFIFKGLFTDQECTKPYEPGTVTGDLKLYALWEPRPEVSYSFMGAVPEGTAIPATNQIDKGQSYNSSSPVGTPQTHSFDGWYTNPECTNKFTDGTPINEDAVLYGKWNENPKISYFYIGTVPKELSAPESVISGYGMEFNAASKPSYTGYTFDGWFIDEKCTVKYVDGTVLTEGVNLYGKWTKNAGVATGDDFNEVLWTATLLNAAAGICVAVTLRRKKLL